MKPELNKVLLPMKLLTNIHYHNVYMLIFPISYKVLFSAVLANFAEVR